MSFFYCFSSKCHKHSLSTAFICQIMLFLFLFYFRNHVVFFVNLMHVWYTVSALGRVSDINYIIVFLKVYMVSGVTNWQKINIPKTQVSNVNWITILSFSDIFLPILVVAMTNPLEMVMLYHIFDHDALYWWLRDWVNEKFN